MALGLLGKRQHAEVEPADDTAWGDGGDTRPVRGKRLRSAGQGERAGPGLEGCGSLVTPAHTPPHGAEGLSATDGEWEDQVDPASEYYSINQLLSQLRREREQRRQQQQQQRPHQL